MLVKELEPIYTKQVVDFYGNNKIVFKNNGTVLLTDCNRPLVKITENVPKMLIRHVSAWEGIAIKEFLLQFGYPVENYNLTQIRKKYA